MSEEKNPGFLISWPNAHKPLRLWSQEKSKHSSMMYQDTYSPNINDIVQGTNKNWANIVHPTPVTGIWESSIEVYMKLLVLYEEGGSSLD